MKFDLVTGVYKIICRHQKERSLLNLGMESHTMWVTWMLAFPVLITALSCPNGM